MFNVFNDKYLDLIFSTRDVSMNHTTASVMEHLHSLNEIFQRTKIPVNLFVKLFSQFYLLQ